ncbi:MAG: class I mannose-6-phosphate isomerase [Bacteroidales bacterium]|nr:class I mannose-6-phosphate isomerase [Bacteroidales bacterium]
MTKLHPLKFNAILKNRVWGGKKLTSLYNQNLPEDETEAAALDPEHIGESWILSDMGADESVVSEGFLQGNSLEDILETYLGDLVGDAVYDRFRNQFPLLIKLLDINNRLSVQVHPDDITAAQRYDSYGKKECWYVLEAGEDAVIWLGFKKDVTATEFYEACKKGTADELLNAFHPKKGECYLINPGTVHAAGGGLVIAEVQESSDVTLRLYDWGRENNPATAREMNLEEAIDIIDFSKLDAESCIVRKPESGKAIFDTDHFTLTEIKLKEPMRVVPEQFNCFVVYICVDGAVEIQAPKADGNNQMCKLEKGQLVLIPASMDECFIVPVTSSASVLETFIKVDENEKDDYINE